jgi:ferredoxin-NADP reductase
VKKGMKLRVKSPRGKFYLDPSSERLVALISAGAGLTPMVSMLNAIIETGSSRPTWFIHGARSSHEHAFGDHVRLAAQEHEHVQFLINYSQPQPEDVQGKDYDGTDFINADLLKQVLPDLDFDFFFCGPPPFMKSLFNDLSDLGVPESRLRYEFFGAASSLKEGGESEATTETTTEIDVTFARSGINAKWNPSSNTLLEMVEGLGLSPDYSCRSGICQTCICNLKSGDVEYVVEPLDEPEQGSVLTCCSKPKSDVVIDI